MCSAKNRAVWGAARRRQPATGTWVFLGLWFLYSGRRAVRQAGLVHEVITRGNPRQVEVDEEREQIAEQIGLSEPIDFQSDMRPPREP